MSQAPPDRLDLDKTFYDVEAAMIEAALSAAEALAGFGHSPETCWRIADLIMSGALKALEEEAA
jgi:hypothetical protein